MSQNFAFLTLAFAKFNFAKISPLKVDVVSVLIMYYFLFILYSFSCNQNRNSKKMFTVLRKVSSIFGFWYRNDEEENEVVDEENRKQTNYEDLISPHKKNEITGLYFRL